MEQEKVRTIILIIASKGGIYDKFREIWERYMNSHSEIRAFFLYGDTDISSENEINCNVGETLFPGIILKTINAMKYIENRFEYEFVVRTNLSSFYDYTLLEKHIDNLPKVKCYSGYPAKNYYPLVFATGCGFILSKDVIKLLIENENDLEKTWDDLSFGKFMNSHHIPLIEEPLFIISYKGSYDLIDGVFEPEKDQILKDISENRDYFHYRVRNDKNRLEIDSFISELLYSYHYS